MFPSLKCLAAAFALLAMLAAQLPGGTVRYLCDCTEKVAITAQEHCHGERIELEPPGHRHHHEEDKDAPTDPEEHHHHDLIETQTDATPPKMVTAPTVFVSDVLWFEIVSLMVLPASTPTLSIPASPDEGVPPPMPPLVARSVVFLI